MRKNQSKEHLYVMWPMLLNLSTESLSVMNKIVIVASRSLLKKVYFSYNIINGQIKSNIITSLF